MKTMTERDKNTIEAYRVIKNHDSFEEVEIGHPGYITAKLSNEDGANFCWLAIDLVEYNFVITGIGHLIHFRDYVNQ